MTRYYSSVVIISVGVPRGIERRAEEIFREVGLWSVCVNSESDYRLGWVMSDGYDLREPDLVVVLMGRPYQLLGAFERHFAVTVNHSVSALPAATPVVILAIGPDPAELDPEVIESDATIQMGEDPAPVLTSFARIAERTLPVRQLPPPDSTRPRREVFVDNNSSGGSTTMRLAGRGLDKFLHELDLNFPQPEVGRYDMNRRRERRREDLTCSVYTDTVAAPGAEILIQVFAHLPSQSDVVGVEARLADRTSMRRASHPLDRGVAEGERLGFHLSMRGARVFAPDRVVVWRGRPISAQFVIWIPGRTSLRSVVGEVIVTKGRAPIGHIAFTVQIVSAEAKRESIGGLTARLGGRLSRYREAFISYASEDRVRAVEGAEMLAAANVNFFQDILSLDPGDRWKRQLYKHIDSSDVFFLFWSSAAKRSTWVRREARYAHDQQDGRIDKSPKIVPIIVEGPPPVKPPRSLNFLHFNDKYIYLRKGVEAEGEARLNERK